MADPQRPTTDQDSTRQDSTPDTPPVRAAEVRLLQGPNLYSTAPVVKVSLELPGYLEADSDSLRRLAAHAGLRLRRPGPAGSWQRQQFTARLVERAARRLAAAGGTTRLRVRTRPGHEPHQVVLAYVWRDAGRARTLATGVVDLLSAWVGVGSAEAVVTEHVSRVADAADGVRPAAIRPRVPVISITGTNGKTTSTRLLGQIARCAQVKTAWSSTDGVVVEGETVISGDYSGPGGARAVLQTPGLGLGLLETARGGLLLKGMGVLTNDVSLVTNVTADHLGMQGIDTLDQLAEVKAIVTTVTKAEGWAVLNGDDPRVWAMRARTPARPWVFTMDPASPTIREALSSGGRATTVMDGQITVLTPEGDPDRLIPVVDVPLTLSGLSQHHVANALGAASAALAIGLPREAVVTGLRTFLPDAEMNYGRLNVFTVDVGNGPVTVIMDSAHNEAGLEALMDVGRGLVAPGGRLHLGLTVVGDRGEEAITAVAEIAGMRADTVVLTHNQKYARGLSAEDSDAMTMAGLANAGVAQADSFATELSGLQAMVAAAEPGDVCALMCHAERAEVVRWVDEVGGRADSPADIRRKVVTARGEHELEPELTELRSLDSDRRVDAARALADQRPDDPRLQFELADALDGIGRTTEAIELYRQALQGRLGEPYRHQARVQLASSLRVEGHGQEALALLEELDAERPGSGGLVALRALTLAELDRHQEAVPLLVHALLHHATDEDSLRYQAALARYADQLS